MLLRSSSTSVLGSPVSPVPEPDPLKGGLETELLPPLLKSCNSVHKVSRCGNPKGHGFEGKVLSSQRFRRAQSDSNMVYPLVRKEEVSHRNAKRHWSRRICSRKHGLLLAADNSLGLNRLTSYPGLGKVKEEELDDEVSENPVEKFLPTNQIQSERDSIPYGPQKSYNDGGSLRLNKEEINITQLTHMININVEDCAQGENPSISVRMSENLGLGDGERYTSVGIGSNGVALVCSARGCMPANLYENDYMAEDLGIGRGGGNSGGGASGGGGGGGGFGADANSTDMYYRKMLEANPGNPLLLRNYAKFLHEVQHDMRKAEEYYGRAILASPGDGEILSLYAKLIWEGHKDAPRAEAYFDQAVQAAPEDCYVLASYAHFLWNSEEDEEENDSALQQNVSTPTSFGSVTATH
eukprot:Gb_17435 [translate_table: standard]